ARLARRPTEPARRAPGHGGASRHYCPTERLPPVSQPIVLGIDDGGARAAHRRVAADVLLAAERRPRQPLPALRDDATRARRAVRGRSRRARPPGAEAEVGRHRLADAAAHDPADMT